MAKELEAEDIELKDYIYTPKEITVNGNSVIDYTDVENDNVFLCNKKDILDKPRPSWIPEFDAKGLALDNFLPICVKDFSDGNYFVQSKVYTETRDENGKPVYKNLIYKMSPDVLAATVDYYLKRARAELKRDGRTEKVSLPRGMNSMPTSRYNEISKLCLLCKTPSLKYKDTDKSITDKAFELKGKSPGKLYHIQNNVVFLEQWQPLLENIKSKRLDMNYQKQDYIDSYSKAVETAYGDSNTFNNLYKDFGVKIKKQNGSNFSKTELDKLSETIEKVYNHYGNLSNLASEYKLKISYADNCMQFARKSIGLFTSFQNAIGISFFNEEKQLTVAGDKHLPDITLAHEIAHWLDNQKGKETHNFFASDKYGTLENQIAEKFKEEIKLREKSNKSAAKIGKADEIHLGEYWFRTCECFARAMEQYYALKQGIDLSEEIAYARKDNFEEDFIPLIEELMEENKRHFGINDISHGISNSSVPELLKPNLKDLKKYSESYAKIINEENAVLKTKPDTFNYLRGANKSMDNKVYAYHEKMLRIGIKKSALEIQLKIAARLPFSKSELSEYEKTDVCNIDKESISLMDRNTFEYFTTVINSVLLNGGYKPKREFPFVLRKESGEVNFWKLKIDEEDNTQVISASINTMAKEEFHRIEEQNTKVKGEYLLAAEEEFLRREEPYKVVDAYSISTKSIYDNVIKRLDSEGYVCRTQLKLSEYRTPSFSELDEYIKENSKKYQPVIVLFDEYNDYDKTTNEYKTIKAWQIYDKESLENGTYISLGKCKINYLNENLELEYKGPFVAPGSQITARSYYNSKGTRELCHIIKEADRNSEEYKIAVEKAASYIAEHIHKSRHTYLVPAPNHNGKAEYTYDIARIVGLKINAPVFNILECKPHETLYEQKKKNLEPEVELFLNDYGKSVISNFPEGRNYIYLIDNCISTGLTFNKAAELINGLIPAVYAIGNFAEVKYVNEKYKVNNLLELKNEITHEENKLMENQEISKYSFIVKDNSEYGSDFEPVKNLSATEAVRLFQKLNESDISENRFGIALHIPGDNVFGEWAEEGISIVTLDDTEKANFSIFGDTFITQLNESDDRSRTYIDAYKDLYNALEQSSKENSENYSVVYPDFLFEKEKELFSEHSVNENKTIGIKPVTLEEILDVMDMRPDYKENGSFMIYDIQRQEYISGWVGMDEEDGAAIFHDAQEAFERLDIYINDYYIHDMQEQLESVGVEITGNETLSDLCKLYKAELEKGNDKLSAGELNLAMGIVEPDTVIYEQRHSVEKKLESTLQPGQNVSLSLKQLYEELAEKNGTYFFNEKSRVALSDGKAIEFDDGQVDSDYTHYDEFTHYDLYSKEGELLCCDGETVSFEGEAQSGNLIFKNNDIGFSLSKEEFEIASKTVSLEQRKEEANEIRPEFFLYGDTSDEKISELKEHLSKNGYDVKWQDKSETNSFARFTCDIDDKAYIQTILEDRGIDYEYELGLLATGYDAAWLNEDEVLDAEVVTREEFKRIHEFREKEFKDLKLPYIKIDFTESSNSDHKYAGMQSGTVLGLKEGEELLTELNNRFNTFLKADVTVYFPDAEDNEPGSYNLRYDFTDDVRHLDDGKEIPFEREGLSDYIRMTCSYPKVLEKYEQQWQKVNAPNITEEQKKIVADIIAPNYEKLKNRYNEQLGNLNTILDVSKKLNSSWIVNASEAKASKDSIEKEQNAIALSFERYAGRCINSIADYLNENKDLSFKNEFINYAEHQISNMLQDVKYGESRNAKYGEHGYDFDFTLWRNSLEKVMDASEYKSFFTERLQIEEKRYKEIRNAAKDMGMTKDETFVLSNEEWSACDELAEKAKMDWWFEEYGSDGDIHKDVSKEDLNDLSTAFDGYMTIDEKYRKPIMEIFKRANIEFNDITLLTTQEISSRAENRYGFYFEYNDDEKCADIMRSEDGDWVGSYGEGGFGYTDSLDGSEAPKIPDEVFRDVTELAAQFFHECVSENKERMLDSAERYAVIDEYLPDTEFFINAKNMLLDINAWQEGIADFGTEIDDLNKFIKKDFKTVQQIENYAQILEQTLFDVAFDNKDYEKAVTAGTYNTNLEKLRSLAEAKTNEEVLEIQTGATEIKAESKEHEEEVTEDTSLEPKGSAESLSDLPVEELREGLKYALNEVAQPLPEIDFTRENYNKLFPYSKIDTPIETVKIGAHQFEKLEAKDRRNLLQAVHDVLSNPDVIINEEKESVFGDDIENSHVYAKSYVINEKTKAVQSVVVNIEDEYISISTHKRDISNVVNKIKKPDQLLFAAAEVRLLAERLANEKSVTVNPNRENEYVIPPQTNIPQPQEKSSDEISQSFTIKGEKYSFSDAEALLKEDIAAIFEELDSSEIEQNLTLNGVKIYGNPEKDGKIKLLVEFDSKNPENRWSEDSLFNAIGDENITFNGMEVDVNPITPEKSGTIEEYLSHLERLGAVSEAEVIEKQAELIASRDEVNNDKQVDDVLENVNKTLDSVLDKKEKILPFSIIDNTEKGRVNIKFDTVENNSEFQNILKELKSNGWKFAPSTKQWYPVGKAVAGAADFANTLQEKYSIPLNSDMKTAMDIGSKKSAYDGIRFFDRNYNESKEFADYFNSHLSELGEKVEGISEKDASVILQAIGYENKGMLENRNNRLGLDKKDNLVILEKDKSDVKTVTTDLKGLMEIAKEHSVQNVEEAKKGYEKYKTENNLSDKGLQDIFASMYEECISQSESIKNKMGLIYDKYAEKKVSMEQSSYSISELALGEKLGKDTVTDIYKISEGIHQVTLSRVENGVGYAQNYFVIDNSIVRQLDSELKGLVTSYDSKSVIENKIYEPYILRDLIAKNLMPPRDDEFVHKLDEYIAVHPLKYEKLKPVDYLNFERKLKEIAEVDKKLNKTPFELGQQLVALVDEIDRPKLMVWLKQQGCDSEENMKKVFATWLKEEPEQKKDVNRKKENGYPPRGEN